jgi:glc operon protein GlcG
VPSRETEPKKSSGRQYGAHFKLIGKNYPTADLYAKVTGQAKYAEDFRADSMLFCKRCAQFVCATSRGGVHMSMGFVKAMLVLMLTARATGALAQAPNPYGLPVSVENAKKAAAAAIAEARKNNWNMAVAVVDPGGTLVYYEKMDNTQLGSADVAIEKARTAAKFKRPSKVFQDLVAGGGAGLRILRLPGAVPFEGGIPLIVEGQIVGAIGVSGDTSDHDGVCAQAGASTLK